MAAASSSKTKPSSHLEDTPLQLVGLDASQRAAYIQQRQLLLLREAVLRSNAESIQAASTLSARSSPDPSSSSSPTSLSSTTTTPPHAGNISGAHALRPEVDLHFDPRASLTVGWMPFEPKRLQQVFQPPQVLFDAHSLTQSQIDLLAKEQAKADGPDQAAFKSKERADLAWEQAQEAFFCSHLAEARDIKAQTLDEVAYP